MPYASSAVLRSGRGSAVRQLTDDETDVLQRLLQKVGAVEAHRTHPHPTAEVISTASRSAALSPREQLWLRGLVERGQLEEVPPEPVIVADGYDRQPARVFRTAPGVPLPTGLDEASDVVRSPEYLLGQEHATKEFSRFTASLGRKGQLSILVLGGPPGHGKDEALHGLAQNLFGEEGQVLELDLSTLTDDQLDELFFPGETFVELPDSVEQMDGYPPPLTKQNGESSAEVQRRREKRDAEIRKLERDLADQRKALEQRKAKAKPTGLLTETNLRQLAETGAVLRLTNGEDLAGRAPGVAQRLAAFVRAPLEPELAARVPVVFDFDTDAEERIRSHFESLFSSAPSPDKPEESGPKRPRRPMWPLVTARAQFHLLGAAAIEGYLSSRLPELLRDLFDLGGVVPAFSSEQAKDLMVQMLATPHAPLDEMANRLERLLDLPALREELEQLLERQGIPTDVLSGDGDVKLEVYFRLTPPYTDSPTEAEAEALRAKLIAEARSDDADLFEYEGVFVADGVGIVVDRPVERRPLLTQADHVLATLRECAEQLLGVARSFNEDARRVSSEIDGLALLTAQLAQELREAKTLQPPSSSGPWLEKVNAIRWMVAQMGERPTSVTIQAPDEERYRILAQHLRQIEASPQMLAQLQQLLEAAATTASVLADGSFARGRVDIAELHGLADNLAALARAFGRVPSNLQLSADPVESFAEALGLAVATLAPLVERAKHRRALRAYRLFEAADVQIAERELTHIGELVRAAAETPAARDRVAALTVIWSSLGELARALHLPAHAQPPDFGDVLSALKSLLGSVVAYEPIEAYPGLPTVRVYAGDASTSAGPLEASIAIDSLKSAVESLRWPTLLGHRKGAP